jgi:hypothetical protein
MPEWTVMVSYRQPHVQYTLCPDAY